MTRRTKLTIPVPELDLQSQTAHHQDQLSWVAQHGPHSAPRCRSGPYRVGLRGQNGPSRSSLKTQKARCARGEPARLQGDVSERSWSPAAVTANV